VVTGDIRRPPEYSRLPEIRHTPLPTLEMRCRTIHIATESFSRLFPVAESLKGNGAGETRPRLSAGTFF
jgi:hypothetical protein